jgi:hypothetical protein
VAQRLKVFKKLLNKPLPATIVSMRNLAEVVLDYLWFLNFAEDDTLEPDEAVDVLEGLAFKIESSFSDEEKQALMEAASRRLSWWLQEPDEDGYTPRELLTPNQKALLEALASGRFNGYDPVPEDEAVEEK